MTLWRLCVSPYIDRCQLTPTIKPNAFPSDGKTISQIEDDMTKISLMIFKLLGRFKLRLGVLALAILLPLHAQSDPDNGGETWPDGAIVATCAPYDGLAFLISSTSVNGDRLRLSGFESIAKAPGRWALAIAARPGAGTASICRTEGARLACQFASGGHFTVAPLAGGSRF
jgi:hypothetical protein